METINPNAIDLSYISDHPEALTVGHSGTVRLQYHEDPPDGNLAIGESLRNVPFEIKRFYFINSLNNKNAIRGKHAHHKLKQAIFSINGKFTLDLDDGKTKQTIEMNTPYCGVVLDGLLWHEMRNFSPDSVILVVADDYYNEADYIRNYEDFRKLTKES